MGSEWVSGFLTACTMIVGIPIFALGLYKLIEILGKERG